VVIAGGPTRPAIPARRSPGRGMDSAWSSAKGSARCGRSWTASAAGASWRGRSGQRRSKTEQGIAGSILASLHRNLDELPLPAWDLTDIDAFGRRRGMALVGPADATFPSP